jgi:hypothetical protein
MSTIFLVYARDRQDNEPLIAVTKNEESAKALEARVGAVTGCRVSWEEFPLLGERGVEVDVDDGEPVHIVSQGGIEAGEHPEPGEDPDSIGVGVFRNRADAEAFARRHWRSPVWIWTVPVGWVATGTPGVGTQ